ncbi:MULTISPECIES: hypothetical protein [Streptomyces]|uniref:Uncharacterized protein n=1 Tax=Streptomyces odorifer TaxID=53450 RepID=A0A7Y6C5P5_9ACTN|nr:hypothetical protein [Streptomyces odorifer]NUV27486.1 hypothetical protein [Streptomyces odorifer]NUV35150.1 hypothetical protein [Streptomyces sp. KAI-27]NUV48889.1 hypothetical protein [Streptomyces sp. CAI-78]
MRLGCRQGYTPGTGGDWRDSERTELLSPRHERWLRRAWWLYWSVLALSVCLLVMRMVEGDPPLQILSSALLVAVWIFNLYALRRRLRRHEAASAARPEG